MPRLAVDLTDAQDFAPIPDGPYPGKALEFKAVESGPKSKYIPIVFQITEGEFAGRKLTRNYSVTGSGTGFFRSMWKALTGTELPVGGSIDVDTDDALEAPCTIVVKNEEYPKDSGEMRPNIGNILSPTGGPSARKSASAQRRASK